MSIRAMGQATVTMAQIQQQLDIIASNLANSQTSGYKSRQTEFQSLLFQQINNLTAPANRDNRLTPDGIRIGTGAKLGAINTDLSLGSMKVTERELDTMLLNENHFYQIQVIENGEQVIRYTRDGTFYLNPIHDNEAILVTQDGHPVYGHNGPIHVNTNFDKIQINDNGSIITTSGNTELVVGQLAIVSAVHPRLLETVGENLFRLPLNLEQLGYLPNEVIQNVNNTDQLIRSGVLEMSNVSLQDEMVKLINAQRSYQLNARTITMADQMQGLINQIR